ncbi:Histidinol-phosphatase [Novipirellula aureliae]|uniref:Histidinol-phosphatase n=2 Tax=Novipirellula aureliae TaxID=2527966 RepID=A0A5C6D7L3_9BACT|nr:Histidinol-phosphatase [Novipirellula aureliae]
MHAEGLPSEYAEVAWQRGLKGLIVTCHNPMPDGFSSHVRMREDQFDDYISMVKQATDKWAGKVDVRLGIEADYFEGYERFLENQLQSADFQYVIGSVHPQIAEYRERYFTEDPFEYQKNYFHLLAKAAETGLFDSISHPDLVKNVTPDDWVPSRIMDTICKSLDRIAATGTAMELNTSGLRKVVVEMNPFPEMLVEMSRRNIPVTLGADAHQPERVADCFVEALQLLHECGYQSISVFLNRSRQEICIQDALASLKDFD